MRDKLDLEKNFNLIQQHELTRLNDLEAKFETISQQYIDARVEL